MALLIYYIGLYLIRQDTRNRIDDRDLPYSETVQKLKYNWFNCNPVHVLKANFWPEGMGSLENYHSTGSSGCKSKTHCIDEAKIYFEFGKEYQHLDPKDMERFMNFQFKHALDAPDASKIAVQVQQ